MAEQDDSKGSSAMASALAARQDGNGMDQGHSLGSVRLHNAATKDRILVPQPSNDPRDPLNW